jgi:hypothetical protein
MARIRFVKGDDRMFGEPKGSSEQTKTRSFTHHPGSGEEPQLFEVQLPPHYDAAPHAHEVDEIMVVTQGELRFGKQVYGVGSSVLIPKMTLYAFTAGDEGATIINFRPIKGSEVFSKDEFMAMRDASGSTTA